jgi:hypothetical protein
MCSTGSQLHPEPDVEDLDVGDEADLSGKRSEPPRNRTENPQIKSLLLCQLS